MIRLREAIAAFLSVVLCLTPVFGTSASSPAAMGTVVSAERAHVGAAAASVGTTVFGGDKLGTEQLGSIQIRAGAARMQLGSASTATLGQENGLASATLANGTATFSTANAKAFALRAATAVVRPLNDGPTIGQVSIVSARELMVKSTRGGLTITVDDQTETIAEGMSYRVVLDPTAKELEAAAAAQGPRGAGTKGPGGPPLKAGRSRFLLVERGHGSRDVYCGEGSARERRQAVTIQRNQCSVFSNRPSVFEDENWWFFCVYKPHSERNQHSTIRNTNLCGREFRSV